MTACVCLRLCLFVFDTAHAEYYWFFVLFFVLIALNTYAATVISLSKQNIAATAEARDDSQVSSLHSIIAGEG